MVVPKKRIDWLYGLQKSGIKLGLDNIAELLRRIDNPQNQFKTIHVAGTNGKGSVSSIIASCLEKQGFKVGLYTSPHILKFNERIKINGEAISDEDIEHLLGGIIHYYNDLAESEINCTFFECQTALAFDYFKRNNVDIAVIEVGMGGRFDATNVIAPEISVITDISIEHTEFLGNTIEEIAFEKSGIIKQNIPCVTLDTNKGLKVIAEVQKERKQQLTVVDTKKITILESTKKSTSFSFSKKEYQVSLPGDYQQFNAALAISQLNQLNSPYNSQIDQGLQATHWPCRMELFDNNIVIDVTHTATGAQVLQENINRFYGKVILVFGVLNDKDVNGISKNLSKIASTVIVTAPKDSRRNPPESTFNEMKKYSENQILEPTVSDAMNAALKKRIHNETILVTGSFHMAEEALIWMKKSL